jgi:hypothetical protein
MRPCGPGRHGRAPPLTKSWKSSRTTAPSMPSSEAVVGPRGRVRFATSVKLFRICTSAFKRPFCFFRVTSSRNVDNLNLNAKWATGQCARTRTSCPAGDPLPCPAFRYRPLPAAPIACCGCLILRLSADLWLHSSPAVGIRCGERPAHAPGGWYNWNGEDRPGGCTMQFSLKWRGCLAWPRGKIMGNGPAGRVPTRRLGAVRVIILSRHRQGTAVRRLCRGLRERPLPARRIPQRMMDAAAPRLVGSMRNDSWQGERAVGPGPAAP